MNELASPALSAWQSFYVIAGSAAAALIGIRNAWDTVTHIVVFRSPGDTEE